MTAQLGICSRRFLHALGLTDNDAPEYKPKMIAATGSEFFTGIFAILAGVVALALAVAWLAFPFLVISKFNDLLRAEKQAMIARREIAKALQLMVDNWKHGDISAPHPAPPPPL